MRKQALWSLFIVALHTGCSESGSNPNVAGNGGRGGTAPAAGGVANGAGALAGAPSTSGKNGTGGAMGGASGTGLGGAMSAGASGGSPGMAGNPTSTGGSSGAATSGAGSSGAAGSDGGMSAGGGAGMGPPPRAPGGPVSNGLRGEEFNAAWKFNRGDASGADKTAFDDSGWRVLDVPHDWSIELAFNSNSPGGSNAGYLDGGIGWYRKAFKLDAASSDKRILIGFDGVYMNSQVWVNGTSLGTRPYGYSSFEYDITSTVKFDGTDNVIAVKVNNNQPNSRWYSGSGIYRNVWLTKVSPIHVPNSGVFVATPAISATSASVSVSTDVQNQSAASASVTVTATITDAGGALVATGDSPATNVAAAATTAVEQALTIPSPKLWSLTSPHLYSVKVEVKVDGAIVDTYVTSLGVRTPVFDPNTGFSLNGQSMKLNGVNMHHDLGALGAAINYRALERQVEILKAMGVNAIRTSHNPPAPELLDITDRLGMLVLEEAFDTWTQPKTTNDYALYFNAWAERDIKEMVRRDRNHPSIILWSIGNEINGATVAIATNLKNWVLSLDDTRGLTWASNKMAGPHYDIVDHQIAALLDVAGYNYAGYAGDYDADHAANPSWSLLGTETAAAVRSRGIYKTPASTVTKTNEGTSSDRQSSSYDNEAARFGETAEVAYTIDNDRPFVAGSFIWAGFDYIGEPTPYSAWPSKSSYYGIVDTAGFPKDIYYFYQSRWTSEPMIHLLPHWNWTNGTNVTVYAYTNGDSAELFLNDVSLGSKSMSAGTLRLEWSVPWSSGTLRAECKKGGSVVAETSIKTAGVAAKLALSADRDPIVADGKDLVFVTADVQDQDGLIVPTAENSIAWSITGPGTLVGLDNGNPVDTTPYKGTSRKAFSGKALAIVRSTKAAGSIVIQATSNGLASEPLTVVTQAAP